MSAVIIDFVGAATPRGALDIAQMARRLGCTIPAVYAVCDIESAGGGFLPDKRPKILYEAHVFGRLTGHKWDRQYPNISAPAWNRALYGAAGAHQYDRLAAAIQLDRRAALNACSWGMFQILGINDGQCGYADVETFVADMCDSEAKHLAAFSEFCVRGGLDKYLRALDWVRFAVRYNGAGEAANHYDTKLAAAYEHRNGGQTIAAFPHTAAPYKKGLPLSGDDAAAALNKAELQRLS